MPRNVPRGWRVPREPVPVSPQMVAWMNDHMQKLAKPGERAPFHFGLSKRGHLTYFRLSWMGYGSAPRAEVERDLKGWYGVDVAELVDLALARTSTTTINAAGGDRPNTDPLLWTTRRVFGVAGGPDEVVLTDYGRARAFTVGAQVKEGKPSQALELLHSKGGDGFFSTRRGSRLSLTDLGRFDQITWLYLQRLGYAESIPPEPGVHEHGVRLTDLGRQMAQRGVEERDWLLVRCRAANANLSRGQ